MIFGEPALKDSGKPFYCAPYRLDLSLEMGRVRTRKVKVLAREILKTFPDRVTTDFELNKKLVGEVLVGRVSKKLRNKVAGYLTALAKKLEAEKREAEEVGEEVTA